MIVVLILAIVLAFISVLYVTETWRKVRTYDMDKRYESANKNGIRL